MKQSPEELEKFIHQALRSLPDRPAPRSLEARVRAAIEARAALPWWKQSFAQWPVGARIAFVVLSAGLVKIAFMATVWLMGGAQAAELAAAASAPVLWLERIRNAVVGIGDFFTLVFRNIPSLWLYGGLACVASLYAMLFGLGATAYRALYDPR